jgi:hypothetical protein
MDGATWPISQNTWNTKPNPEMEAATMAPHPDNPSDFVAQPEIADKTIAFWQKRTNRSLNAEDARQIVENLTGFFGVLADWAGKDRKSVNGQYPAKTAQRTKEKAGLTRPTSGTGEA